MTVIDDFRTILRSENGYTIYNIMGAIRGPDKPYEQVYKEITRAIRSYMGFNDRNCSGDNRLMDVSSVEDFTKLLKRLEEDRLDIEKGKNTHYLTHLCYAIDSIGKENLIKHAEKMIEDAEWDDVDEEDDDDLDDDF